MIERPTGHAGSIRGFHPCRVLWEVATGWGEADDWFTLSMQMVESHMKRPQSTSTARGLGAAQAQREEHDGAPRRDVSEAIVESLHRTTGCRALDHSSLRPIYHMLIVQAHVVP